MNERLRGEIENHRFRAHMLEMQDCKESASDEWFLVDCLSALRNIMQCGDCNICADQKTCKYAPRPGEMVRYNCPFFRKGDQE